MFIKFLVLLDGNPSNNRHSEFNVASEVSYFCRILAYRPGQVFGGALLIRAGQRRGVSGSRDQNIASQCCSGTNMRQSLVIWGYRNHAETSNSVIQRKRNLFANFQMIGESLSVMLIWKLSCLLIIFIAPCGKKSFCGTPYQCRKLNWFLIWNFERSPA